MIIDMFRKKKKYSSLPLKSELKNSTKQAVGSVNTKLDNEKVLPNKEEKCPQCNGPMVTDEISKNLNTCNICSHHFRISARDRINSLVDKDSFLEMDANMRTIDSLSFPEYEEKITKAMKDSGETDGIITGHCKIENHKAIIAVMEPNFMMGSMGCVVGEKLTRAIEKGYETNTPVIVFSASGGARMQEGVLSLMQMAKTSSALSRLNDKGILYISVLTNPTTGGVTASFAMLGDIIIAEPKALICFAGPRVIEQTLRQKLPEGFQRAEFLKEKGFIDIIIDRTKMRASLSQLLDMHVQEGGSYE